MRESLIPAYFEQVDYIDMNVKFAQELAAIRNETIRRQERLKVINEWIKPENIEARIMENKEWEAKTKVELPPLPDPLPFSYMKGQAPSIVRRMLAHEGWEYDKQKEKWEVV